MSSGRMRVRRWAGVAFLVVAVVLVAYLRGGGACEQEESKQEWPEPIELNTSHGSARPDPDVRRKFDGVWRGVSGNHEVTVRLRDGLGYCVVEPPGVKLVIMVTAVSAENNVVQFWLEGHESDFVWLARPTERDRLKILKVTDWRSNEVRGRQVWPRNSFELKRRGGA